MGCWSTVGFCCWVRALVPVVVLVLVVVGPFADAVELPQAPLEIYSAVGGRTSSSTNGTADFSNDQAATNLTGFWKETGVVDDQPDAAAATWSPTTIRVAADVATSTLTLTSDVAASRSNLTGVESVDDATSTANASDVASSPTSATDAPTTATVTRATIPAPTSSATTTIAVESIVERTTQQQTTARSVDVSSDQPTTATTDATTTATTTVETTTTAALVSRDTTVAVADVGQAATTEAIDTSTPDAALTSTSRSTSTQSDVQQQQQDETPASDERRASGVSCVNAYQACLSRQNGNAPTPSLPPHFVVSVRLLPQFCGQHENLVQPCMTEELLMDRWTEVLARCEQLVVHDRLPTSAVSYTLLKAARLYRYLCQRHQLHLTNDSDCFLEKLQSCVLSVDEDDADLKLCESKCQPPERRPIAAHADAFARTDLLLEDAALPLHSDDAEADHQHHLHLHDDRRQHHQASDRERNHDHDHDHASGSGSPRRFPSIALGLAVCFVFSTVVSLML